MWRKEDDAPLAPTPPAEKESPPRDSRTPNPKVEVQERASIGRSITIIGEVRGEEDLLIQGQVEGSVDLREQSVTVGQDGHVKANINGRIVTVDGEVEGDLQAREQVILRASARVQGDIISPRVVLEDGASFRGLVDMRDPFEGKTSGPGAFTPEGKKPPDPKKGSAGDPSSESKATGKPGSGTTAPGAGEGTAGTGEKGSGASSSSSSK